jgi:phenylacetate-coenzyme A ligase PaaK-like adenylate-forming protein
MPLIRYLNGDLLELSRSSKGKSHLRISRLEGRVVDQLTAVDGHRVSGAFVPHLVFRSGFPAWKYQVVQTDKAHIEFHYLLKDGNKLSSNMKGQLVEVFRQHLGSDLDVVFIPGQFEMPPSGKHRFVINKLMY